ncbi:unnamed protein product [Ectocarpus fasciculatus]
MFWCRHQGFHCTTVLSPSVHLRSVRCRWCREEGERAASLLFCISCDRRKIPHTHKSVFFLVESVFACRGCGSVFRSFRLGGTFLSRTSMSWYMNEAHETAVAGRQMHAFGVFVLA